LADDEAVELGDDLFRREGFVFGHDGIVA
jgi:hypothetical protein